MRRKILAIVRKDEELSELYRNNTEVKAAIDNAVFANQTAEEGLVSALKAVYKTKSDLVMSFAEYKHRCPSVMF